LILDQVLQTLDRVLGEHLEAQEPKSGEDVLTFTRGE